ncbi:MAG: peptidase S10 [Spirosomataceae bacterium]
MKKLFFVCLCCLSTHLFAQETAPKPTENKPTVAITAPVVTKHQTTINGVTFTYTATTGFLQIMRNEDPKMKANIFFIAYTRDDVKDLSKRAVTFTYNGGPGSASVWLHMGCIGPKRIIMSDKGEAQAPPYKYVNNEYSWLDKTDLVFIDPVNTGYSRAADGSNQRDFLGYVEDIESVGEFIRLYATKYGRWGSPKFLAGESYGTTRSAGLSGFLQDRFNMYINGVTLISTILNFQTARFTPGNDLPYSLFLPTYTAMAWYHKKIAPKYQGDLQKTLKAVEDFALNEYSTVLMKGDVATDAEKKSVITKLSEFTGLSEQYIKNTQMRIEISRFCKELLRNEGKTAGRLDGRMTGTDYDNAGEKNEFDPSLDATISGPYSGTVNHYLRQELKLENDLPYLILTGRVQPWNYSNVQNQYLNVAETLRQAMAKNPYLKVHVMAGYYDLATPYFAAEYTFNHMMLNSEQKKNVRWSYYEAGHMMYIHKESLLKMKKETDNFYDDVLK